MTNKINGIDVNEEMRYCNNCSNLGLDFKTHKFYCSLSHRPDELPKVLSCDEFNTNCYIKRLQEENEKLKQQLEIDKNQINYFIEENEKQKEQIKQLEDFIKSDGEIDHINHEYTYKLRKENEELKRKKDEYYLINLDYETKISYLIQALEEIRIISQNWTNKLMNDGYCEILDKINEVLNNETTR